MTYFYKKVIPKFSVVELRRKITRKIWNHQIRYKKC